MTTEMDVVDVEVDAIHDAPRVPTTFQRLAEDAPACVASNDVFLCRCCFVWEVTRGPHAGERAEFTVRDTAATTTLLRIGRHAQCWLRLKKDLEVSGFHAELRVVHIDATAWKLVLRDDKSTNGTKINGEAAEKRVDHEVKHQDLLLFGRSAVRVTRGSTRCPLAVQGGSQGSEEALKEEPTEEPEPPRVKIDSKTQAKSTEALVKDSMEDAAFVGVVAREEHGDDDAFEETERVSVVPAASASRLLSVCMVCGQELSAWSVLEQQLHVNACLDKANGVAAVASRPSTAVRATGGGGGATVTTTTSKGKKRKRQQTTLTTQPQDEELAVALALSKSLVGKEQQAEMDMALVSSELAQVDAQLAKLQKKRLTLIKKLERLEKAKRKVHKGDVRSPEEAKALLDLSYALRVLFPEPRRLQSPDRVCISSPRPSIVGLLELYRGEQAQKAATSGTEYVAMWVRASQQSWENETELFTNQLTRELLARAEETAGEITSTTGGADDPRAAEEPSTDTDTMVPHVVKRVFPEWEQNLVFLKTQSVDDLKSALEELRQARVERQLEKAMQMGDDVGNEANTEDQDGGSIGSGEDDEELACAFFEQEMIRLIDEGERKDFPEAPNDQGDVAFGKDVEIVELMDSDGEDDVEFEGQRSEDDMGSTATASTVEPQMNKGIEGAPQSSDEDEETASGENSPLVEQAEDAVVAEDADDDCGDTTTEPADCGRIPVPNPEDDGEENERTTDDGFDAQEKATASSTLGAESLETQLLNALKANAVLYEAVLLLQPLDLQQFLEYLRHEARIKCAKTELIRFCDRHGITFKQS